MADHRQKIVYNDNNLAFAYYRYSSAAQREESIEEQQKAAHQFAESHGFKIIREYQDAARSGTDENRPGFQQMLHEAAIMKPGHLIVWKSDRLAREMRVLMESLFTLDQAGVKVEYIADAIPEDGPLRKLMQAFYAYRAESFIDKHKDDVIRGMNFNAEHCLYNGKKMFGYIGKAGSPYQIDPVTSVYVQKMFNEYADGKSSAEIVKDLNDAGVRTARGNTFTINALMHILNNRAYIGEYHWGETITPDGVPRIIDDNLWNRAHKRIDRNKRGGRKPKPADDNHDYWLTGHLVCGLCGTEMCGLSGTSHTSHTYYYYLCLNHQHHKCKKKNIRADLLESIVENTVQMFLQNPEMRILLAHDCYLQYEEQNKGSDYYIRSLDDQSKDVEHRINNVMNAIEQGIITSTTKKRLEDLEHQQKSLQDALAAEKARRKMQVREEDILKWLDAFVSLNMEDKLQRTRLIDALVDKVYVYDDRVDINMVCSEDPISVSFDDYTETMNKDPVQIIRSADYSDAGTISDEKLSALKGEENKSFKHGVTPSPLTGHSRERPSNGAQKGFVYHNVGST